MGSGRPYHKICMLICDGIMSHTEDYMYFVDLDEDGLPGTHNGKMVLLAAAKLLKCEFHVFSNKPHQCCNLEIQLNE